MKEIICSKMRGSICSGTKGSIYFGTRGSTSIGTRGSISSAFPARHGSVIIDGSGGEVEFKYAKTAITSFTGGVVHCKNAKFINCTIGVDFQPYLSSHDWNVNQSNFENTTFTTEDQVSRYITNDNVWMHYKHDFHHHYHVKLHGVRGISFGGCKFKNMDPNTFTVGHDNTRGTGIWAEDAGFVLHDDGTPSEDVATGCPQFSGTNRCEFTNLSFGIYSENTVPVSGPKASTEIFVQHSVFTDCHDAIASTNGGGIRVYRSNFNYTESAALFPSAGSHHHFVDLDGTNIIILFKNIFASNANTGTFIEIANSTASPLNISTKIQLNTLTNSFANPSTSNGITLSGDNTNTDIKCNDFNPGMKFAIAHFGGVLKPQGSMALGAGNLFAVNNCDLGAEQYLYSTTGFTYFHQAASTGGINPALCKSAGVTVTPVAGTINRETSPECQLGCSGFKVQVEKINRSDNFKMYPNPSNNYLVVESLEFGSNQLYNIVIYDMVGKVVLVKNLSKNINGISLEGIIPGVYTASILKNNEVVNSIKLVKQ